MCCTVKSLVVKTLANIISIAKVFSTNFFNRGGFVSLFCHQSFLLYGISIMLRCQLCSTRYTAVQIKNCSKSTSTIKVATIKKYRWFLFRRETIICYRQIDTSLSAKMNGTQRRTLVSSWRMHCMCCGMPKGTFWAKVTLNSEKIKLVALAVIELRLSEGISQSVIIKSIKNNLK